MKRNDPTIAQQLQYLLPQIDVRFMNLRGQLEAVANGERSWGLDIELAMHDVLNVLDMMVTQDEDDISVDEYIES